MSPLICEIAALKCLSNSMWLVQMVDHYVPSLAGKGFRGVRLASLAAFCGIVQPANEYRLVFLLMFLPVPTIFVRLQLFTYCAPIVIVDLVGPSRVGRPVGTVPGKIVGSKLRSARVRDQFWWARRSATRSWGNLGCILLRLCTKGWKHGARTRNRLKTPMRGMSVWGMTYQRLSAYPPRIYMICCKLTLGTGLFQPAQESTIWAIFQGG